MYRLSALILLLLCTSCATIVNRPTYKARIRSNAPNAKAIVNDSTYTLPARVELARSTDSLQIQLVTDSITKDYTVASKTDGNTVAGNLALFGGFGFIGMYVDKKNLRSRHYGRTIFLDIDDASGIINPRKKPKGYYKMPIPKGTVNLTFSLPYVNNFFLQHKDFGNRTSTGFLGAGAGLEYYYKNDRFLKLAVTVMMDFEFPIPIPIDYDGEREAMSSLFVSLTTNHRLGRFTLGYGPSWTVNTLIQTDRKTWTNDDDYYHREHITRALGLSLTGHYQLTPSFHIGLLYNPNLLNVTPVNEVKYSHTLSLDLQWKVEF